MEALVAVGLASNILDFVNTGTRLCALIKQYSSVAGAPDEVVAVSKRLELTLSVLNELDKTERVKLDQERLALKLCTDEAEELRLFLQELTIGPNPEISDGPKKFSFLKRRTTLETGWKAYKALRGGTKMEKFQASLNRILDIIMLQQQSRIEVTTLRVEEKAGVAVKNSELILKGLSELQLGSEQPYSHIPTSQSNNTLNMFMVPLGRNAGFLGRNEIMAELDLRLGFTQPSNPQQVQKAALCGLGGVGKSQIALEYAYRKKQQSPQCSIFRVYAGIVARFEESYKRIAAEFELPGRNEPLIDVLQIVRNFLEAQYRMPWLMIVDNIDDSQIYRKMRTGKSPLEYIPQVGSGSVLFTSRNRDIAVDLVGEPINVPLMSVQEARMLLGGRTRGSSTEAEQDMLLKELDHLPLAITQAASYMTKRRKTVAQYLRLLQDGEASQLKLLAHNFVDIRREATPLNSVMTTWIISFQQIKSENPRAVELLFIMGFLDRQSMPISLLIADDENPVAFDEAIGILEAYSFVSADETGTTYSMHRLVQAAIRAWLRDQEATTSKKIASQAVQILSSRFPDGEFENWATCAQYLPHAESVLSRNFEDQSQANELARAKLLANVAWYFRYQSSYALAKAKAVESLDAYKTTHQPDCAEALQVKSKLATIIREAGNVESAVTMYREIIEAQEKLLGNDHLDTLETVEGLASALTDSLMYPENFKEGEILARRALVGREKALPNNHPTILRSLSTLGWSLYKQRRYSEAEVIYRDCKSRQEIVLGELHPDTSATINDLALVLMRVDKNEEAERLMRHSVDITSMLSGAQHRESIVGVSNLCVILSRLGKYEEAEMLERNQIALSDKTLGKNHPTTISCITELSYSLCGQKKHAEAEALLREQLLMRGHSTEADLEDATDTGILDIMTELADVLVAQQKKEEAKSLYHKVLAGRQRTIGETHPETLVALHQLGNFYDDLGDFNESENYFRKAMVLRQSELGEDDLSTLRSAHNLGRILEAQETEDKSRQAEEILLQVVAKRESVLGKVDNETLASVSILGHALCNQKKYPEAEACFRRVLIGREQTLGEFHEDTLSARGSLEMALIKQEKWGECIKYCRQSLTLGRKLRGQECYDTLRIASNLAFALVKDGQDEGFTLQNDIILKAQACYSTYMEIGNHEEAILAKEQEMYINASRYGWQNHETMNVHKDVALLYEETGKSDKAEEAFKSLLTDMEEKWGFFDPRTCDLNEELAQLLDKHGKPEEAAQRRRRLQQPPPSPDASSSVSTWSLRSTTPSPGSRGFSPVREGDDPPT